MRLTVTYKRYDIVKVPFPFTDRQAFKNRPALVLSDEGEFNSRIGHTVMTMITSAKHADWPLDTTIQDLVEAGLKAPSKIRLKLFTLDDRLILGRLGGLGSSDQSAFEKNLHRLLGL
jgi:mRNA interferase MazF